MTWCEGDPSYLNIYIIFGNSTKFRIRRTDSIGTLKGLICREENLDQSALRLLLNGERIEDSATPNSLGLEIDDFIEAFKEVKGGGLPGKRGLSEEEVEKLLHNIDEELDDNLDTSADSEMDEEQTNANQNLSFEIFHSENYEKRLPKQVIFNLMKSCKLFQNLNLLSIFRSNLPIAFQAREHQRNTFEYLKCKPSGEAARRIFPF